MSFKSQAKSLAVIIAASATLSTGLLATPASAAGYHVDEKAMTTNFAPWDHLNVRRWPAAHSRKVNQLKLGARVNVQRCIIKSGTDWCLIKKGRKHGWVNGHFISRGSYTFASPHPDAYGWH